MDKLPDRENTNFPLAVTNALKAVSDHKFLLKHQVMPRDFFTQYPKARGLLFCHETGSGKSISAVSIADEFIAQGRRVIVVAASALQNNFRDNIYKYYENTTDMSRHAIDALISKNYAFVSGNASNMLLQLKNASLPTELQEILDEDPDTNVKSPDKKTRADLISTINLEGSIVIVDEAHHLFNGIVSSSQNARGLFDIIMRTKNIKLLFLTSNAIINTPFELVPCFNMIAGYELLPELYQDFMDTFVQKPKRDVNASGKTPKQAAKLKNLDHFKARIYGMVSYFGSWFQSGGLMNIHSSVVREHMPTRLPIKEVYVPMSIGQYGAYAIAREKETRSKSYATVKSTPLAKPSGSSGDSTYRIRSRLLSNYWQYSPDDATVNLLEKSKSEDNAEDRDAKPAAGGASAKKPKAAASSSDLELVPDGPPDSSDMSDIEGVVLGVRTKYRREPKPIEKLDPETLRDLPTHSPKFAAILENIAKHPEQVGLVYSAFVKTHGLDWFAAVLETRGYSKYVIGDFEKKPRYAYITGDMSPDERSAVLFAFNGSENRHGEIIQLLLGSPAMSEGVDTKRIRHVHIMESPWHFSALDQIIARAVRLHSHDDLPSAEQNVQPYIYLSDYPPNKQRNDEPTTDIAMYYKAIKKKMLNDQFFRAMIESSIDCNVHIQLASAIAQKQIKCMMCAPTDKPMFIRNIIDDIASHCACVQTRESEISVSEIQFAGRTFYYRKDPSGALHLFEYDTPTSSYIRLSPMSKWYKALFKKLQ